MIDRIRDRKYKIDNVPTIGELIASGEIEVIKIGSTIKKVVSQTLDFWSLWKAGITKKREWRGGNQKGKRVRGSSKISLKEFVIQPLKEDILAEVMLLEECRRYVVKYDLKGAKI